jgi:hypothetical protein
MVPGEVYEVLVDMWNTSYVFNKGHAIRLAISSSNSPRFKPNPNTGVGLDLEDNVAYPAKKSRNSVHVGGKRASRLIVPVVDLADMPKHRVIAPQRGTEQPAVAAAIDKNLHHISSADWLLVRP